MSNSLFKSLSKAEQYVNTTNSKLSCKVATTSNITLSDEQTIDSVSVTDGNRVLVKNQTTGSENGIYVCSTGQWFRSTDMNSNETCRPNSFVFIENGSTNADKLFQLTTNSIVLDTTNLTFEEYGGGGGDGSGDIEGVIAGTGLTGGGTTGTVTLNVIGGTGITANADDIAIDSTVATLTGSQTLTNKTLTSAVLNGNISGTSIKDEDNMASDSASHLATQQSIKAYVDTKQDSDAELTALAGLTSAANKIPMFSGSGTATLIDFKDEDNMSSNSATAVASQQSVKAYVDSQDTAQDLDFQGDSGGALNIDLDSETLTLTGGTGIDTTGSSNTMTFAIDSTVSTLTGSQTLTNKTLTSAILNTGVSGTAILDEDNMVSDSDTQLATQQSIKAYVDSVASGLDVKDSCRVATTSNITLSNTQTIDGVSIVAGNRVLVKDQSTGSENGIYLCVDGGGWTRTTDFDSNSEVTAGAFTFIEEGSDNADAGFVLTTNDSITIDSTSLSFAQFSGAGQITAGSGLDKSGNTLSVDVSDFMTNGSNNRILTATGTDGMNAEANLTFDGSTMNITGHIIPSANNTYDLGSASNNWRDIYVSSDSIVIGNKTKVSVDSDGDLEFSDKDNASTKRKVKLPNSSVTNDMLSGSIANDKLAGSIANGKLANSSITIDGSATSLGGSITTNNTMGSGFVLEDGDGTEVTITENKEIRFVEGKGIDIDWTDTSNGTDGDPYDLTFSCDLEGTELKSTGESGGSKFLREDGDGTCSWQTVSDTSGNAATATALESARTIGGVSFDGTGNINLPGVNQGGNQDTSGNAATATALESARTIHGVSFDGTGNIDLSEVIQDTVGAMFSSNTETGITATYQDGDGTIDLVVGTLNQNTSGNAATATALESARTIGGVSFDGTDNINLPGVNSGGNQDTSGTAAIATSITASANNSADETVYLTFVDGATGTQGIETDTGLTYNPSSGVLTTTSVTGNLTGNVTGNTSGSSGSCTGNAATATALASARTIHGVSFDGTGNIDLSEVIADTVGAMFSSNTETGITATYQDADNTIDLVVGTLNQDTTGNANTATALATARTIGGVSFDGSANIKLPGIVTHSRSVHKTLSRLDISTSFLEISSDLRIQMILTEPNVTFTLYLPRLRPNSKVLYFNMRDYNASGTPSLISDIQPVYDIYAQEPVVIRFTLTGQTIGSTIYATPIVKANGSTAYLYRSKAYGFMEFTATEFSNAANNSSIGLLYAGDS